VEIDRESATLQRRRRARGAVAEDTKRRHKNNEPRNERWRKGDKRCQPRVSLARSTTLQWCGEGGGATARGGVEKGEEVNGNSGADGARETTRGNVCITVTEMPGCIRALRLPISIVTAALNV